MISSTIRKVGPFVGNGVTKIFPFSFKVFAKTDLVVVKVNTSTGVETTLAIDADYTVTLNIGQDLNPGGIVTLKAALAVGSNLIVSSNISETQETQLANGGGFYPEVINAALDKLTILIQQIREQVDRCLKLPISDPSLTTELAIADSRKGLVLGFDAITGAPKVIANVTSIVGNGTNTVAFSATPVFDLSLGLHQEITLTGNVTSSSVSLGSGSPAIIVMRIKQDGTGGHTFAWPTNFDNAGAISTDANAVSTQIFAVGSNGRATACGPIMYS